MNQTARRTVALMTRWAQRHGAPIYHVPRVLEGVTHPAWLYRAHGSVPAPQMHYREPRPVMEADVALCQRLIDAYALATRDAPSTSGVWGDEVFEHRQRGLVEALTRRDADTVAQLLASMFRSDFVLGVASGSLGIRESALDRWFWPRCLLSNLISLAESQGRAWMESPEQGSAGRAFVDGSEALVAHLEDSLGTSIDFPDVGAAYGIEVAGRLMTFDSPEQIYAAARLQAAVTTYLPEPTGSPRVVEIGGGYGGMANWVMRKMAADYFILDLPLINVLQGYFLSQSLGASQVSLYGEPGLAVTIFPTHARPEIPSPIDVVANKDSLPEIPRHTAIDYLEWIRQQCRGIFYSYNQEAAAPAGDGSQQNVVPELVAELSGFIRLRRDASWLRRGYAEEVYRQL